MMIKRDRTVCDTCGAEVSGWRPWYEPRSFHDYSKHNAQFRADKYPPNDARSAVNENADPITAPLLTGHRSTAAPSIAAVATPAPASAAASSSSSSVSPSSEIANRM